MAIKVRFRNDANRFQATVWCGNRRRRKLFVSKPAAEAWGAKAYYAMSIGQDLPAVDRKILFRNYAEVFLKKYSTNQRDRISVKPLAAFFDSTKVSNISEWQLKKYIKARKETVGNKTINHEVTALRHMLNVAHQQDYAPAAPRIAWAALRLPTQHRTRVLTVAELERVRAHLPTWVWDMVTFALNTGLRFCDLRRLRADNFDMVRGVIVIARQAKTCAPLTIPLSDTAREIVGRNSGNLKRTGFLFLNTAGRQVRRIYPLFAAACRKAGVTDARFHDLRHTIATKLAMGGASATAVAAMLGNTPKIAAIYQNFSMEYKRELLEKAVKADV